MLLSGVMTALGVDGLDAELVARVAAAASARGETIEDVVARALAAYVRSDSRPSR
jgi:hypothetical protein